MPNHILKFYLNFFTMIIKNDSRLLDYIVDSVKGRKYKIKVPSDKKEGPKNSGNDP